MNRFTIPCTEEQTKKALKLGAPIKIKEPTKCNGCLYLDTIEYIPPTAEQMIGWLEEQGIMFNIATNPFDEFKVIISKAGGYDNIANIKWNKSKKEATLAAINAALDYLINNKK